MPTNATIFPVNGPAVIWFEDGTSITVETQERKDFQIPKGSFCTISDAPDAETGEEEGEHPPPGYALADAMIKFWTEMKERWHEAVKPEEPEVNPL